MSFTAPELIFKKPQNCKNCGIHIKYNRAVSWEFGFCPKCYESKKNRKEPEIDPMNTVVRSATINPMTLYLDIYTHFEMEKMK